MNDGERRIKLENPEIAPDDRRLSSCSPKEEKRRYLGGEAQGQTGRDETFPGAAVQVRDRALNLIGDSHEWRVIYPTPVRHLPSLPRSIIGHPRPARSAGPVSPVRGHCAKLCSNGDGVTLICLSPLLHSRRVIRRASLSPQVQRQPLRYCHGSTSWRLDRPSERASDRSIDPRRDTLVLSNAE